MRTYRLVKVGGMRCLFFVMACCPGLAVGETASQVLTISATALAPTCDLSVVSGATGGMVTLGSVDSGAFSDVAVAASSGQTLTLSLSGCQGVGGGTLKPTVKITGSHEGISDPGLYRRAADSSSTGVGILLRYNATSATTGTLVTDASQPQYWVVSASSLTVPATRELSFWMAMSRGTVNYADVHSGSLKAGLNFSFEWH